MKRILLFTMMCLFGLFSLNAQETTFSYDFEDGTLNGWRVFSRENSPSAPFWAVENGQIYSMSFDGGYNTYPSVNNYIVTANAYGITANSKLSWSAYHSNTNNTASVDRYEVVVSEIGLENTFQKIWEGYYGDGKETSLDLSDYAGMNLYIGFRHYCTDEEYGGDILYLDNIALTVGEGGETPGEGGDETNNVVTIGSGSTKDNTMPTRPSSYHSATQQIYTASEINHAAGAITKIALKGENPYGYIRTWEVYLANTDKTAFSSTTDWVTEDLEKVFDGQVTVPSNADWFELSLTNNFNYKGNSIVLCVIDKTGNSGSNVNFYTFDGSSLSVRGSSPYDVNSLPTAGYQYTFKNQIQLTFAAAGGGSETPTPTAPEAPVVTATATGSTTATLTWEAVDGATSYNVYMLYAGGEYLHGTVTETSYNVSHLVTGANNCFDVTAVNEVGESERTNVCVLTYPAAPQNLVATANETTITLTWGTVTGAESYNVYSGTETVATALTDATFTTEELAAGNYCYTVTAVNASGESIASTEQCATIEEQGDDEPGGDVVAGNVVTLDVVADENGNKEQAFIPLQSGWDNTISEQIFLADDFKGNTGKIISYAFRNSKDIFSYGTPITVTRNFKVYMINTEKASFNGVNDWVNMTNSDLVFNGSVTVQSQDIWTTITFDTPFEYEAGKNVILCIHAEGGCNNGSMNFYKHETDNVRSLVYYNDTQIFDATNITVASKFDDLTYVAQSQFTFESTGSTPEPQPFPAPQNLAVTDVTETSITLTWDAVDGAEDYYVYKDGQLWSNTNGATTYTENGLTPGTTYCFKVSAVKDSYDTESELSEQLCETTLAPQIPIPATPQNLAATSTETTITLTWDAVDGAVQYGIYMKYNSEDYIRLGALTTNSYEVPGFSAGETVCFKVSAENGTGESALTEEVCATTLTPETSVVVLPYRLQSITGENTNDNLYYVYSDDTSRVESITKGTGTYKTFVEYNEDGTVAKTTYAFIYNGAVDNDDFTTKEYTYTDGVLTSYKEETKYYSSVTVAEYTLSYNEDGTVAEITYNNGVRDCKYAYEYEDGKLVKASHLYYDEYAYEPGFIAQYYSVFEYDENGNCVNETKYSAEGEAQSGVDYFYDLNVDAESVYAFTYPHEVLPTNANLLTKALSYTYNQERDWETMEVISVTKGNFSVKTYNYNEEVVNAPVAPINLVAKALNDTKVVLTWETLEEVESFKVYNGEELVSEGLDVTTDTVKGLEPLTEYSFTVVAVNGELESAASEAVKVTTYNLVNVNPTEIAFGRVIVGDYWTEKTSVVNISIDRFGKEVKAVKTDNNFFRVPASITYTDEVINTTVDYKKNSEAGEYEGNLLVILASGDTVKAPMTATAYAPVTPDVFELAQEVEMVDGLFSDMPDFSTLADDYNLPGEAEGNNPDAVYTFTLEEEATVEISVEANGCQEPIYAVYKEFADGEGPKADNAVEPTDKVFSTVFSYDFEDGSLEDFEIQDNDGNLEYTMKVEDGALITWAYRSWYDENGSWQYVSANERAITKEAYNITEKSVLTFDAQFVDEYGNGDYAYGSLKVQVTKDGETYTDVYSPVNYTYSAEFESYRVDLGTKFTEEGLEYGEYKVVFFINGGNGTVAVDNIELSERAWVYPAGKYYIVAAGSTDFKVTVKSDALPELELNKDALYRLVSTELDFASTRYNYASKVGTKVVNVKNTDGGEFIDFLKYNDEGLLLGYVTCSLDDNGGIYDTTGVVEYIYEDSLLVRYKESYRVQGWMGGIEEGEYEYTFHYNADGRIDTVRGGEYDEVKAYTYNEEGQLVELVIGNDTDEGVVLFSKEVYTYADSNLVKVETSFYDDNDSIFLLLGEYAYEYDSLGNCISMKEYEYQDDYENDTVVKAWCNGENYVYDYSIAYEDVFYFEYPHYVYTDQMSSPAKPSHANIILAKDAYSCYFDEELGKVVFNSQRRTTYRYEEYTLEGEDAPEAPATPQNFVAKATSDSTIVLTWDAVEGATGYNVYQGTETLKEGLTETTYTVTGLAAATTYTFEVVAVNGDLVSNRASATAKTLDADTPDTPDTPVEPVAPAAPVVKAEATSDTTIVLTWNKVEGALTYNVYQGADTVAIATALTDTTYVVSGLTANTEYTFGVTAVNEAGESARGEAKAKTLEGQGLAELNATVNIYPNPAVDRLVIETDSYVEEVSIYAITGTLVYREVDFNSNTIDVSELRGGVYVMKVRTDNGEVVKRFIKK